MEKQLSLVDKAAGGVHGEGRLALNKAIAAALAEAEMMNERAEQAGAEWKRAREAWRRRGDLVRSAFFAEDFDILDQFFGGGEGEG
jgi:hypothetical protein